MGRCSFLESCKATDGLQIFMRGGDRGTQWWNDVVSVKIRPTIKSGAFIEMTTYSAELVSQMLEAGLWLGTIPEIEGGWE